MLLFRCELTHNELASLKNALPQDGYCIIGKRGALEYYGVITAVLHGKLMDTLSGETLGLLEYVDEEELKSFLLQGGSIEIVGEVDLIAKYQ